jgi:hypothetical protein
MKKGERITKPLVLKKKESDLIVELLLKDLKINRSATTWTLIRKINRVYPTSIDVHRKVQAKQTVLTLT